MKTIFCSIVALIAASYALNSQAENFSYYGENLLSGVRGSLTNAQLKAEIKRVLSSKHQKQNSKPDLILDNCIASSACYSHTPIGYTNARKFLLGDFYLIQERGKYAVREVYCGQQISSDEFRNGQKPGPNLIPDHRIVNVEHTWPQSKFSRKVAKEEQKSDLHHLFPTDSEINSVRSSFEFGEVTSDIKNLKCPVARFGISRGSGKNVFEPPQEHKGNVARALFYFSVKYDLPIRAEEEASLKSWNREDPVDEEEKKRNEMIFSLQFSKNPFIDFPELADRISDF